VFPAHTPIYIITQYSGKSNKRGGKPRRFSAPRKKNTAIFRRGACVLYMNGVIIPYPARALSVAYAAVQKRRFDKSVKKGARVWKKPPKKRIRRACRRRRRLRVRRRGDSVLFPAVEAQGYRLEFKRSRAVRDRRLTAGAVNKYC
jgi:hypothetical protein